MSRRVLRGFDPDVLRHLGEAKGMGQSDLARHAEVSVSTVWAWETGANRPYVDRLAKIAQVLGVPISALVDIPVNQRTVSDLRILAGLTQPALAQAAGISTTALQYLERGETRLTDERAARLAPLLHVSAAELRAAYERARTRPPGSPA